MLTAIKAECGGSHQALDVGIRVRNLDPHSREASEHIFPSVRLEAIFESLASDAFCASTPCWPVLMLCCCCLYHRDVVPMQAQEAALEARCRLL